ncbi:hypothetical protein ACFOWE_18215 [Planomonospora corallina]|uniref:Uncharacterized protein n=1 Tax=Planomonospora corallina TaxID=1806052 RepID=A0ABV8I7R3_9ACTN
MIRVQPARELRRDFAAWAVAQTPKVRTVSTTEFGVPDQVFPAVPEELLYGALVDGHPYVPAAAELEEREAVPGEAMPEIDPAAYPPGTVPLDPALGDGEVSGGSDASDPATDTATAPGAGDGQPPAAAPVVKPRRQSGPRTARSRKTGSADTEG